MSKCRVVFTGVVLALIVLTIIFVFNYIAFLEEENRIFLTHINNSIIQLQMKINSMDIKRNPVVSSARNRGFLMKDTRITSSKAPR